MNLTNAIERLRDVLRRQHLAIATESTYVYWLPQGWSTAPIVPGAPNPAESMCNGLKSRSVMSVSHDWPVSFSSIAPTMA